MASTVLSRYALGALLIGSLALGTAEAQSPVGSAITYQGQLKNNGGPANGSFSMEFRLFDALASGNPVGPTLAFDGQGGNPSPVNVTDGLFTVALDFGAGVFNSDRRWLEIKVAGQTLTPRQELTAAPTALYALNADRLDGLSSASFLQAVPVPLALSGTHATHIIRGENASTANSSAGVLGVSTAASGFTYGVFGQSNSTNGFGLYGYATAATGPTYGVWGQSLSTSGYGVVGSNSATSGLTYGGSFGVASTSGRAVNGMANAATGTTYGGYFESASTSGTGVYARASAGSGSTYGVNSECLSTSGIAVFGLAGASTGITYGVYGQTLSTSGYGVVGYAQATSGTIYGVLGATNSAGGYGVYSNGRFAATGTKSFQIDHPLDPDNKTLLHYCSEGPEPLNIYGGHVTTDAQGLAWVQLPDYFEALNREPRYQLTVIGQFAQAIVAEKIQGNRFAIRTSRPGVEVSWEIKAVRNDRFVQRYGAPVEVEKSASERGKYLMPALYDQPRERGIFHRPDPGASGGDIGRPAESDILEPSNGGANSDARGESR